MGLCKCPKKKVTNLFCFEHRVNVCESCLVENHSKCVVQSYLQWLQDSDYNPNCSLCNQNLQNEDCVRLACYDLFHWRCLDESMQRLPSNTAPAGYECPACARPVIPPENAAGPVVDGVRARLRTAVWAQTALGLGGGGVSPTAVGGGVAAADSVEMTSESAGSGLAAKKSIGGAGGGAKVRMAPSPTAPYARAATPGGTGSGFSAVAAQRQRDVDENKYARRPAFTWLAWVLRSSAGGAAGPAGRNRQPALSPRRRLLLLGFLIFLAAATLLYLMSTLGRQAADSDPMLRPELNPNIRVQDHHPVVAAAGAAGGGGGGSGPEAI